jgi:quinol monooxygenase YgiN
VARTAGDRLHGAIRIRRSLLMLEPIVVIDRSEVRDGKLDELKTAVKELAEFVASNESRPISYNVYLTPDGRHMTVIQVHPDSASMEFHMRAAASEFPRFADLLDLSAMEIFGTPSDALLQQIRRKAEMLGDATVVVHDHHAGFDRFRDPLPPT